MSIFDLKPKDLIEYEKLLEQPYLYPYWQKYFNGINLSFVNSDQHEDLSLLKSDEKLTTLAIKEDYVSIKYYSLISSD
jgi:hypothetical protein